MKCFSFANELETVRNRQKIARCARRFMRPSKVEMATSHTEVVQLLAARPCCRRPPLRRPSRPSGCHAARNHRAHGGFLPGQANRLPGRAMAYAGRIDSYDWDKRHVTGAPWCARESAVVQLVRARYYEGEE